MRKMTYVVPLIGRYEISNLIGPGDTLEEDAFRYDRIYARIGTSDLEQRERLFSIVSTSRPDVSINQYDIVPALEGKLPEWSLCMARIDSNGLEVVLLHDREVEQYPIVTCKLNGAKSKFEMYFRTENGDCDIRNRYFYRESYSKDEASKTSRSITVHEEYGSDDSGRRHITFKKAAGGSDTDLIITEYLS